MSAAHISAAANQLAAQSNGNKERGGKGPQNAEIVVPQPVQGPSQVKHYKEQVRGPHVLFSRTLRSRLTLRRPSMSWCTSRSCSPCSTLTRLLYPCRLGRLRLTRSSRLRSWPPPPRQRRQPRQPRQRPRPSHPLRETLASNQLQLSSPPPPLPPPQPKRRNRLRDFSPPGASHHSRVPIPTTKRPPRLSASSRALQHGTVPCS